MKPYQLFTGDWIRLDHVQAISTPSVYSGHISFYIQLLHSPRLTEYSFEGSAYDFNIGYNKFIEEWKNQKE